MPSSADCWGIEVGANAIKAIRLRRSGAEIALEDFEVIPFKKVLTTPDLDVDEAIRVGLDQLLARHTISKSKIVVSAPGHMAFARFAKLPPVEPKRIGQIVQYEAQQQIPFPIEQVEWDYQTFQDPDSPDVEVGIFAMTKERLIPWLQNFQAVGLDVQGVVLSPVAVYNAVAYDRDLRDRESGTIIMDIGTQATDLIISEGYRVWLRTIPIGGNHFTEALVRSFKLSFSKAEKLKREATTHKYSRQIFQAMRPVFVDLVQEVQKSLGYYQSLNRDANLEELLGLGSTFRLPGLQTFLKQQLQIDISRVDEYQKIEATGRDASNFADNALGLAPAYGLALQGLDEHAIQCNLLPTPMARRQAWQRKKPWFGAAAALVLLGTVAAWGTYIVAEGEYQQQASTRQQIQTIVSEIQGDARALRSVPSDQQALVPVRNLNQMLVYREVWPSVLRDVEQAVLAMDADAVLLGTDVQAIQQVPRSQRPVVRIRQMTAQYTEPGGGTGTAGRGLTTLPAATGQIDWENNPPTFLITLRGVCPHANAPTLLEERFGGYLRGLAAAEARAAGQPDAESPASVAPRPTRMYRVVPDSILLRGDRRKNIPEENLPTRGGGGGGGGGGAGGAPRPPAGIFVPGAGGPPASPTPSPDDLTAQELMPTPPLADEDKSEDFVFTMTWTIALKPPTTKQIGIPDAPPPSPDGGQPAEPAESEPAAEVAAADRGVAADD